MNPKSHKHKVYIHCYIYIYNYEGFYKKFLYSMSICRERMIVTHLPQRDYAKDVTKILYF